MYIHTYKLRINFNIIVWMLYVNIQQYWLCVFRELARIYMHFPFLTAILTMCTYCCSNDSAPSASIPFPLGEQDSKPALENAQLLEEPYPDGLYLPLDLGDTGKGEKQGHIGAVNVQGPSEEYYAPMELNDSANHSQAHEPQPQVSEEYYVEVDNDQRSAYNKGEVTEDQEYYTPMEAGIVRQPPLLPAHQLKGVKTAAPSGEKKAGTQLANSNQSAEQRDRSDTVIEYANTSEWTAAQPLPSSTHRYINFTPVKKEGGQKQTTANTKPLKNTKAVASKPPQTAPKPAKTEELPIYGNISPKELATATPEEEDNEASEPEDEYVVPY